MDAYFENKMFEARELVSYIMLKIHLDQVFFYKKNTRLQIALIGFYENQRKLVLMYFATPSKSCMNMTLHFRLTPLSLADNGAPLKGKSRPLEHHGPPFR